MDHTALDEEPLLMDLLVKNVSRDNPLSSDEITLLKDFKERLESDDEWKYCLRRAREEKAKREHEITAKTTIIIK